MARFKETVDISPVGTIQFDSSALTSKLDAFSQQKAQEGAQLAAQDAFAKGQAAFQEGEAPEFKQERFFGKIPAKAYNEGLRASYVASLDHDNREEVARIASENASDLSAFNDQVDSYRSAMLNNVDPSARQVVQDSIDSLISSNRIKVQNNEIAKNHKENAQQVHGQIEAASNDALGLARDGENEGAATSALAAFAAIDAGIQSEFITSEEGAAQKRSIERGMVEEGKLGGLLRTFDDSGETAAFEELDALSSNRPGGFTPAEWDSFISRAQSKLAQKRSRSIAETKATKSLALEALKDFEKGNALGFDFKPSEVQRVDDLVSSDPALKKRFDISNATRSFSVMPASDRSAILGSAQTGELEDVDQFAAMVSANTEIAKQVERDGLGFAFKQGIVDRTPLELGNPESFAVRIDQARAAQEHYGAPVSPLTDSEAEGLADALPAMTVEEKIQMAETFVGAPEIWGQLSKKQATTFAMAGATGDTQLMRTVFKGQELIDSKTVKPIKPADYLSDFNDYVEGVYGPKDAQAVLKSAIAFYAQSSENKDGTYSSGDFEDALEAVTGGIAKINGFKLELPRGVDEDDFEDFIDDIQPSTIEKLGGVQGLSSDRAAEVIKQARIRNIKSGEYIVQANNGTLMKPDGTFFVIPWSTELAASNAAITANESRKRKNRRGRGIQ